MPAIHRHDGTGTGEESIIWAAGTTEFLTQFLPFTGGQSIFALTCDAFCHCEKRSDEAVSCPGGHYIASSPRASRCLARPATAARANAL